VIYFYEDHGHVVGTKVTESGYKEINDNKAHFNNRESIMKAIDKVYYWEPKNRNE